MDEALLVNAADLNIGAMVGTAAVAAAIVYGLIRARTDWLSGSAAREQADRDEVHEILELKDEMIAALKSANEELRAQNRKALDREESWNRERADYERRLGAVEDSFRNVVTAVVNAGICAKAATCDQYVAPGERRSN